MALWFTLVMTKAAAALSRRLGLGVGQAFPGLVAERLYPRLAGRLAAGLPHGVILVTGTNGKTTTTMLIAAALRANGERVLTNSTGSNLKRGITAALLAAASLRGTVQETIGLFEVDEASLRLVAADLNPTDIVVLNLFRDQLDRYGELDVTAGLIADGIAATTARLHLNADDPLVTSLSRYAARPELVTYFGVEARSMTGTGQGVADSERCPVCGARLEFSRVFYAHIGHYRCPHGDFARPRPRVALTDVQAADATGSRFTVEVDGRSTELTLPLAGSYNLSNALAAVSVAHAQGIDAAVLAEPLAAVSAAFGRAEVFELAGRRVHVLLAKNPVGLARVLETFVSPLPAPRLLFAISDLRADGRDVSWLWDVPLGTLVPAGSTVLTTGTRGADMSLRLHYDGIASDELEDVERAVDRLVRETPVGGDAYILPTYTAMLKIRALLTSGGALSLTAA
ncbi:MAG TPA: MurT ligase domain-containing protein [Cellulomonas sp.]|uniref:MurT ligase domain-containing protein n=1 Tax=Cellulomonas sp. TaxID=40001 RepID=UPI002E33103E|nr:MurT ligase domain-containing protein [Cellulomonas sp.]HEX5331512.1 MurT ligase domain-containing protein [Cellulomonas sp.]